MQVRSLPPTGNAAQYHSLRVYQQVQSWLGNDLEPTEWGFKIVEGILLPITMDGPPAPPEILKMIRCTCKGYCDTKRCRCKLNGLYCTDMCSECMDGPCVNIDLDDCIFNEDI